MAEHVYMGLCPDATQPDSRDPECPGCIALNAPMPALIDPEDLIRSCLPGGSICDPQLVADAIRTYFAARTAPTAAPHGWRFYTADASIIGQCRIVLTRDEAGTKMWHVLTEAEREEIVRAAIDERMAKPQHPFGDLAESVASGLVGQAWMAFGQYEGRLIALPEYAAASAHAVGEKIMEAARREDYCGSLRGRLDLLGWSIRRVILADPSGVQPH